MKFLKKLFLGLLILIGLLLIVALFVKKDYAIQREISINRSRQVVFNYIKLVKNQDNYSVWNRKDPKMKKSYSGTDGSVGFIYSWESADKHVGVGQQEILKVVDGERIEMKLRFKVPFEAQDDVFMSTTSVDSNTTKVVWGFSGTFKYPFNLMGLFFNMDKEVGGDLGNGLIMLKDVLEKQ